MIVILTFLHLVLVIRDTIYYRVAGYYGKAMQALQRLDVKVNLNNVSDDIEASLPPRNLRGMSLDLRRQIFRHTDATTAVELISEDAVLKQLKRLRKNRSPGVDGFTVEHLISIFLGGNRNVQLVNVVITFYKKIHEFFYLSFKMSFFETLHITICFYISSS